MLALGGIHFRRGRPNLPSPVGLLFVETTNRDHALQAQEYIRLVNFYALIIKSFYMIEICEILFKISLRVLEYAKAYQPPKQTIICREDNGSRRRAELLWFPPAG